MMNLSIREELKQKFAEQLDAQCAKGENKYGHALDTCPDNSFDWRDMLIQELIDGLQYQEKEIRRLKTESNSKDKLLKVLCKHSKKPPYADLDDE
jgi:hypothetical protein